jgi:hypothetical protein
LGWRVRAGAPVRASSLWCPLVRAGRVLRHRVLEYWGTGVLGYWSAGVLVRVGVAGPGRRPSPRHFPLFLSGPRRSGAALSVGERAWGFSPDYWVGNSKTV